MKKIILAATISAALLGSCAFAQSGKLLVAKNQPESDTVLAINALTHGKPEKGDVIAPILVIKARTPGDAVDAVAKVIKGSKDFVDNYRFKRTKSSSNVFSYMADGKKVTVKVVCAQSMERKTFQECSFSDSTTK